MSHSSEVARLRQKIANEYEAMKSGLSGLSLGNAKHAFIDARMKRIDGYHSQLVHEIGEYEATVIVCELYTNIIG